MMLTNRYSFKLISQCKTVMMKHEVDFLKDKELKRVNKSILIAKNE
jgi:hypothetical protein